VINIGKELKKEPLAAAAPLETHLESTKMAADSFSGTGGLRSVRPPIPHLSHCNTWGSLPLSTERRKFAYHFV